MEPITDPGLLLKVTPPKLRRTLLARERLRRLGAADDDAAVILVEAPAGYGKTSLIAQWRLDWLQNGVAVGWLNLVAGDSPITLVSGIALGLRRSLGRAGFGADAIEAVRRGAGTAAALTSLLAEVMEICRPVVIVFDNGEHLRDAEAVDVLEYLLHNMPPNLRVVIGTRPPVRAEVLDLLGRGLLRRVTAADLCFDLPEVIQLLTSRFGGRIDADRCARLHEVTGGWPLGLQLAAAALERSVDPACAIEHFSKSQDDATQHLFQSLVASLPNGLGEFLTRCSLLGALHPSLCEAVTGKDDAALALQRLLFETPLLSATEGGEWLRLHPLAREYLRSHAEKTLSEEQRREIHVQAWHWLADHGAVERAALHAMEAGFQREAIELITTCLETEYDQGHHGRVNEWLARIPPPVLQANYRLRLVALWMDVLDHRFRDALLCANALLGDPSADGYVRSEALVAVASAYAVADRQDDVRRYIEMCETAPIGPRARQVMTLLRADAACNAGDTELARRLLSIDGDGQVTPAVQVWHEYFTVWSYLLEGRPILAGQIGLPQHAWWAAEVGRRGLRAATLGSLLAAACWQQDSRAEARSLLANRVDVIEQASGYAGLISAYLTLTRMAACEGDEARAYVLLEALAAIGERRGTVRLVIVSLAERIRMHAVRRRPARASELSEELATVVERSEMSELLAPQVHLEVAMARAFVGLANSDLVSAGEQLARARALATRLNRGYETVQVLALQALLAERSGEFREDVLIEALSRAESGGLVRVFADTLPEVVELVRRYARRGPVSAVSRGFIDRVLAAAEATPTREPEPAPSGRSALLTPKESQVLQLLAGGLQNKQIATELDLSADTVKWHVKKLLAKLNAGNRDHAVDRARMLGLLR